MLVSRLDNVTTQIAALNGIRRILNSSLDVGKHVGAFAEQILKICVSFFPKTSPSLRESTFKTLVVLIEKVGPSLSHQIVQETLDVAQSFMM